jgi:rhodanese-related sulfurtransferase
MTAGTDQLKKLSQVDIFSEISAENLAEIEGVVQTRTIPAGAAVFREGDPGDSFCMIDSGKVRVFRKDEKGVELELALLGPGDSFGEMALFTGEARSATVEAMEETLLSVLPKARFDELLKKHPDMAAAFVKLMSKWVRHGDSALQAVAKRRYEAPKLTWIDFVLIIGLSIMFALVFNQSNPNGITLFPKTFSDLEAGEVTVSEAMKAHESGEALFVDAMPSNFFEQEHIAGSINIPLALFDFMYLMTLGGQEKDKEIIVYGRTISSRYDQHIASKLILRGHKNVKLLKGGLSAWKKKGYPVEP